MITIEAVNSDLDKIAVENPTLSVKCIVAIVKVIAKLLSTMRSNQLLPESQKIAIQNAKEKRQQK